MCWSVLVSILCMVCILAHIDIICMFRFAWMCLLVYLYVLHHDVSVCI